MTDDRRLEIERRFDGELLEGLEPPKLSGEPSDTLELEARRHWERLELLRELARRHDPASTVARKPFPLPERRSGQLRWWPLWAATAAAAVLAATWAGFPGGDPPRIALIEPPEKLLGRLNESSAGRPPLEIALYGWANTPSRAPQQGARLVLSPGSPARKRSPADEILALELANASPQVRSGVQRFAVARGSKSNPGPTRSNSNLPGNRGKSTRPDV